MKSHDLMRSLQVDNGSKIVLAVADGLGGLPGLPHGRTELEAAQTPTLDRLAREGICGLQVPVAPGITPGSGPGHLGLFGYDPLEFVVGRGVLSTLGIGFDLRPEDVTARGNFCTLNGDGRVTDRRAGRISSEEGSRLVDKLREIQLPNVEVFVEPIKEYRFALILRGQNLGATVAGTDPEQTGVKPEEPRAQGAHSRRTAELASRFIRAAEERLRGEAQGNGVLLRGFSSLPSWPRMDDIFGLRSRALASYPMYRGLAKLVGMEVPMDLASPGDEIAALRNTWKETDFFFLHFKSSDSAGEDGSFGEKMASLEAFDHHISEVLEMKPDVLMVTGDHSTPALMGSHSFHPVPVVLAAKTCRPDLVEHFGERACLAGGLGQLPAHQLMPLAMAHAGRLRKFGA